MTAICVTPLNARSGRRAAHCTCHTAFGKALFALASAGQIAAGLSHDAGTVLKTLGLNMDDVERQQPDLQDSIAWQLVRDDLELLRFMAQDTMDRIAIGHGNLEMRHVVVRDVVEDVLARCRRYFIGESEAGNILLTNGCDPH